MAELKPGDAVPSDCTAVDKLPVRMLASTDGALAYATGTGVTSIGKLLMSSREQDYRDAFAANGLTICDDDELGYDFCKAESPLRLPLKGGVRVQVVLFGMNNYLVSYSADPEGQIAAGSLGVYSRKAYAAALRAVMATVTKGARKILFFGQYQYIIQPTLADMLSVVFYDVDFTGWDVQFATLNETLQTDIAAFTAALSDPDVSILVNTRCVRDTRPAYAAYDCSTTITAVASAIHDHVAAGGGLIDTSHVYAYVGLPGSGPGYDEDYWTGIDPFDEYTGDRLGSDLIYDFSWISTIFPGMRVVSAGFLIPPESLAPGFGQFGDSNGVGNLTTDGVAALTPLAADALAVARAEYDPGYFLAGWNAYAHFTGDLNGLTAYCHADPPYTVSGGFTSNCVIGGVPSFSALA